MTNYNMTKADMVEYLKKELEEVYHDYRKAKAEYEKAGHMDRIEMAHSYDKIEDRYFYIHMLCNDLGIIGEQSK